MPRRRISRARDVLRTLTLFALLIGAALYLSRFSTEELSGPVVVLDGDSLRMDGRDIRLQGMDAPEFGQTCADADQRRYDCGAAAKDALTALVSGAPVRCESAQTDRFGRLLSICFTGEDDVSLNERMVALGWAVDFGDYPGVEAVARREKRGLWAGTFENPRAFRDRQRGGEDGWLSRFLGGEP